MQDGFTHPDPAYSKSRQQWQDFVNSTSARDTQPTSDNLNRRSPQGEQLKEEEEAPNSGTAAADAVKEAVGYYQRQGEGKTDRQALRSALRDLRCARATSQTKSCERHDRIQAQRQGLLPDLPTMQPNTGRSFATSTRNLLEEEEGDSAVPYSYGEARGRKRSSPLLSAGEQAARSQRPSILRSSAINIPKVSRELPDREKLDEGEEVLRKRRKLHFGSPIHFGGETDAMEDSDNDGTRRECSGSDGSAEDSERSDSEDDGASGEFNTFEFEEPDAFGAPTFLKATSGLWSPIPMGQDKDLAATWGDKHRQDNFSMLSDAFSAIHSAFGQTSRTQGPARRDNTGRYELQAPSQGSSNSTSGYSNADRYPRTLQSSDFTSWAPKDNYFQPPSS